MESAEDSSTWEKVHADGQNLFSGGAKRLARDRISGGWVEQENQPLQHGIGPEKKRRGEKISSDRIRHQESAGGRRLKGLN